MTIFHNSSTPNNIHRIRHWLGGLSSRKKPNMWLWILFFALNFILFLPAYLFNRAESSFFPPLASLFTSRENYDIFRFNVEWGIITALWINIHRLRQSWYRVIFPVLFTLFYFLMLLYQIYETAIGDYYHTQPNFYDDWLFVRSGFSFLLDGLQIPIWYFAIGGLIIIALIWVLAKMMLTFFAIPDTHINLASKRLFILMAGLLVVFSFQYTENLTDPQAEVSSFTAKLVENVQGVAISVEQVAYVTNFNPYSVYDFTNYSLRETPNIYLIFVESYGSVLYKSPYLSKDYLSHIKTMESTLHKQGWQMASTLSTSPTSGGGSWMAYTSAQYGIRISKQPQYIALREEYQDTPYPSLGRYLQNQGYEFIWVTPIARHLPPKEAQENDLFYAPDRWLLFDDMDYQGPMYGWGPSSPDQFTLGFAQSFADENVQKPLFLFYLTQNSHYPWSPLPPIVDNWQDLNDPNIKSPPALKQSLPYVKHLKNYMASIDYTLATLTDFIANSSDEHAIFVLVGDHQPPIIARKHNGNDTPVHIISKDADFVAQFLQFGFEDGLVINDLTPKMSHETLYPLLVRTLNARYGQNPTNLPPTPMQQALGQ